MKTSQNGFTGKKPTTVETMGKLEQMALQKNPLVSNQQVQLFQYIIKIGSFIRAFQHIRCCMITHLSGLLIAVKRKGRLYGGLWKATEVECLYLGTVLQSAGILSLHVQDAALFNPGTGMPLIIPLFCIKVIQSLPTPLCTELIRERCSESWLKVFCYTQNNIFQYKSKKKKKSLKT